MSLRNWTLDQRVGLIVKIQILGGFTKHEKLWRTVFTYILNGDITKKKKKKKPYPVPMGGFLDIIDF